VLGELWCGQIPTQKTRKERARQAKHRWVRALENEREHIDRQQPKDDCGDREKEEWNVFQPLHGFLLTAEMAVKSLFSN